MSFKIAGRMEKRLVAEGDFVRSGQLLAVLEKSDQSINVAKAEASLAYAKSVLAELEAGSRMEEIERSQARVMQARQALIELQNGNRTQEIDSVRAEHERALAAEQSAIVGMNQAKNDYERYAKLYSEGGLSRTAFENYQSLFEIAQNRMAEAKALTKAVAEQLALQMAGPRIEQIRKAEAALQQAEAEHALIKAGPRQESIDQARAKVQIEAQLLNQAKQQLLYTELVASMDGVVLSTTAESGEYLNPASPVLTLGELENPWLRAYIHEKDLGRIKLDQEVSVSTDSFPTKKYTGRVSFISSQAEFTPKTVQTFEERVKLMFRIKVTLDNRDQELKPGMPADGFIVLAK
jgi:HlyD family secretion protein